MLIDFYFKQTDKIEQSVSVARDARGISEVALVAMAQVVDEHVGSDLCLGKRI